MLRDLDPADFSAVAPLLDVFPFHRPHYGSVLSGANPGRVLADDARSPRRALALPSDGFAYLACAEGEEAGFLEDCAAVFSGELSGLCIEALASRPGLEARIGEAFGALPYFAVPRLAYPRPAGPPRPAPAPGPCRLDLRFGEKEARIAAREGADGGGREIGCCGGWIYRGELEVDIGVEEGLRGRGWGAYLGVELLRACAERGLAPRWTCWEDKAESRGLAERLGFRSPAPFTVYIHDPEGD